MLHNHVSSFYNHHFLSSVQNVSCTLFFSFLWCYHVFVITICYILELVLLIYFIPESVPSVPCESYPIFNSIRISEKIANGFLVLLLSLSCGIRGLIEGVAGICLGLVIHYLVTEKHILIPFPMVLTSILLVSELLFFHS